MAWVENSSNLLILTKIHPQKFIGIFTNQTLRMPFINSFDEFLITGKSAKYFSSQLIAHGTVLKIRLIVEKLAKMGASNSLYLRKILQHVSWIFRRTY
jgi:hypothetical protein